MSAFFDTLSSMVFLLSFGNFDQFLMPPLLPMADVIDGRPQISTLKLLWKNDHSAKQRPERLHFKVGDLNWIYTFVPDSNERFHAALSIDSNFSSNHWISQMSQEMVVNYLCTCTLNENLWSENGDFGIPSTCQEKWPKR